MPEFSRGHVRSLEYLGWDGVGWVRMYEIARSGVQDFLQREVEGDQFLCACGFQFKRDADDFIGSVHPAISLSAKSSTPFSPASSSNRLVKPDFENRQ